MGGGGGGGGRKEISRVLESHIQDLKFHRNGSLIASASSDGSIKFWEIEN